MRITSSERRVYQAAFQALSHEGFLPAMKIRRGREMTKNYPEYTYPITCAYIGAVLDWLSPSAVSKLAAIRTVDELIASVSA